MSCTAVVQPGVRNLAISAAAAPYGLYYAPDPSSQIACTIGGNVGENAGGVHCLKYGLTVHNVRRVRGVLITGEVVEFGGDALDSAGYDLLALIHGSEGLLAVTTEITVKLTPKPQTAQVALAAFADVGAAGAAVAAVIGAGIVPAGLEMMDKSATRAVEEFVHAGYPLDAAAVLLVETDGTPEEVAADMAEITRVLAAAGRHRHPRVEGRARAPAALVGPQGGVSRDRPHHARLLLHRRHDSAPRARARAAADRGAGRRSTSCAAPTCSTPATATCIRSSCTTPTSRRSARAPKPSAPRSSSFASKSAARSPESTAWASKSCRRCACSSGKPSSQCFLAVKAAFDPQSLLNPGKGVPTLSRCAEFGKMHVHHGKLAASGVAAFLIEEPP